ncbi:MAG: hypothetical protein PSV46_27280 [Reyranella sp.]|nr:hypothetical protein [Reyranella sp.]
MAEHDQQPTSVNVSATPASGGVSGLAFIVGGLVVAVLAVGYFLMGMPGIGRHDAARAPEKNINVTIEQPKAAPAAPAAPATPAAPRQ